MVSEPAVRVSSEKVPGSKREARRFPVNRHLRASLSPTVKDRIITSHA